MDILGTVVNIVLVVLTLIVIWFAWQTVRESRKATKAARETVDAVGELLTVSRAMAGSATAAVTAAKDTVAASRELVNVSRQTVEVAKGAREADEHDRRVRHLWRIAEVVERAFAKAAEAAGYQPLTGWSCSEQRELAPLLVSVDPPLPKCTDLAGTSQAGLVVGAARDARDEIADRLRQLHADAR